VTFASGSTDVNERAIETLQRFVTILNSPAAINYELMVAGHTDNRRVTMQRTIDAGNFDNWYLSAHRAISVAAELVKNGVSKSRLGVAGYADQQPIASNSTESGRAQNRRVEIVILPTHPRGGVAESGSEEHQASARTTPRHLDKDAQASNDSRPAFNK
jgi:chemotaxis protein MotB